MRTIRASEIGTFLYCQRAWWYQQQGIESGNLAEMAGGARIHAQHARAVLATGALRFAAYAFLLASLLLLAVYLTLRVI
jgi:hypothetical protein